MDAGALRGRVKKSKGRQTFWIGSACFARVRVFHALQHYVAHLKARIREELGHKWEFGCAAGFLQKTNI
jgi:hypothetical protein